MPKFFVHGVMRGWLVPFDEFQSQKEAVEFAAGVTVDDIREQFRRHRPNCPDPSEAIAVEINEVYPNGRMLCLNRRELPQETSDA